MNEPMNEWKNKKIQGGSKERREGGKRRKGRKRKAFYNSVC